MAPEDNDRTVPERLHSAEETVAAARDALEKAESGLQAARRISEGAADHRRPILVLLAILAAAGLLALLVSVLRG